MKRIFLVFLTLILTTNVYGAGNNMLPKQYSATDADRALDGIPTWNTLFYVPSFIVTKGIEYYIKDSESKVIFASAYNNYAKTHAGKISLSDIHSSCDAAGLTYKDDMRNSINDVESVAKNGVCMQLMTYFILQAQSYKANIDIAHKGTPLTQEECQRLCANSIGDNKCYWSANAVTDNNKKGFCIGADGSGISFYPSCTKNRDDNTKGQCIDIFKDIQVQELQGLGLIYVWGKKQGVQLTCLPYRSDNNQDYIECTAGGKAYDFEFDDLEEPKDFLRIYDEKKAICAIYGLSFVQPNSPALGNNAYCPTADISICLDIESNVKENLSPYYSIRATDGKCEIITLIDSGATSCFGLNGRSFADIQVRATSNLIETLRRLVTNKIGNRLSHFKCYSPTIIYPQKTIMGTEVTYSQEVIPCEMTDSEGNTCTLNFEFDDLSENSDTIVSGDLSKMACDTWGGTHDGRKCNGLSKQQCADIANKISGGTHWDDESNACVMNDASKSQTITNINNIIAGVVITAVTLYVSGGSAILVLVATGGSIALDGAFIGLERLQEINPHHRALQFLADSKECSSADCAKQIISNHFVRLNEVFDQLNDEEFTTVATEIDRISALVTEDEFNDELMHTNLNLEDLSLDAATPILAFASLFIAPENTVKNLFSKAPKFAVKASRFVEHVKSFDNILLLRNKASKSFDIYLNNFLHSGQNYALPKQRLNDREWRILNQDLAKDGIEMFEKTPGMMSFRRINNVNVADIDSILNKFNKTPILRLGRENSLGYDYYRIVINDDDDVANIIAELQRNGYYVSANQTIDGEKFLAASKNNIFAKWNDAPANWLNGYIGGSVHGRGIFDKIYNDMPEDVLRRKLDYVYAEINRGASNQQVVDAMQHVGAFDAYKANLLAQDIADETIKQIRNNPNLMQTGKNWKFLSEYEKKQFILELHDIITRERRERVGNTIIWFDNSDPLTYGWHRAPYGSQQREFAYNYESYDSMIEALETIIHENTHSFQSVYTSSIPEQLVKLSNQYYIRPEESFNGYRNVLIEVEARYVSELSAPQIVRALGW